jgi:hypothetical protein
MCRFLPVLQAQILDIASTAGVGKCKSKTFSILSIMGLPFVPPLRFIAISSFIQCYLFCVHVKRAVFYHSIPVAFITIHPSNHCSVVYENMYKAYELFILKMGVAVRSMIIYFMPPDWGVKICVDTSSYHRVHV